MSRHRTMLRASSIFAFVLVCIAGCARDARTAGNGREAIEASARQTVIGGRPVITHLVGRDYCVTITAGMGVTLYSATNRAGVMLATNVTAEELKARVPAAHQLIAPTATALADSGPAPIATMADTYDFAAD